MTDRLLARLRPEDGAAALVAIVIVVVATVIALGCVDVALLGVARARAGAAADAAALAGAIVVDAGPGLAGREAAELAQRNGADLVGAVQVDPAVSEVGVEVEVVVRLPLTGTHAVRARASARLVP